LVCFSLSLDTCLEVLSRMFIRLCLTLLSFKIFSIILAFSSPSLCLRDPWWFKNTEVAALKCVLSCSLDRISVGLIISGNFPIGYFSFLFNELILDSYVISPGFVDLKGLLSPPYAPGVCEFKTLLPRYLKTSVGSKISFGAITVEVLFDSESYTCSKRVVALCLKVEWAISFSLIRGLKSISCSLVFPVWSFVGEQSKKEFFLSACYKMTQNIFYYIYSFNLGVSKSEAMMCDIHILAMG
jgi:hypothetical protein